MNSKRMLSLVGLTLLVSTFGCQRENGRAAPMVICHLRGFNPEWTRYNGKVLLIEEFTITNNGGYLGRFYSSWSDDGAGLSGITNSGVVPRCIVRGLERVATPQTNAPAPLNG